MSRLEHLVLPDCNVTTLKMVAWILTCAPTLKSIQVRFIAREIILRMGPLITRPLPDFPEVFLYLPRKFLDLVVVVGLLTDLL